MTIQFMVNNSDNNVLDKVLTTKKIVDVQVTEDLDVLNNSFLVSYDEDIINCNYLYNDLLKRFYFIDSVTVVNGQFLRINCSLDSLYTYRTSIRQQAGILNRQNKICNLYLQDDEIATNSYRRTVTKLFPTQAFDVANSKYILLTTI